MGPCFSGQLPDQAGGSAATVYEDVTHRFHYSTDGTQAAISNGWDAGPEVSRTQSVTTRKQETRKQSLSRAAPKPSYSHVVQASLQPRDPGKVSPDGSRVTSRDTSTPKVSRDLMTRDPGNKPHDLPRDWSSARSRGLPRSPDRTRFRRAPSPLIGTWKTVGTINGLLNNQQSHETLVRSTKAHLSLVFTPALKYGPPV